MFESPGKWHKLYSDDFGHHLFFRYLVSIVKIFSASVLKANCSHDLLKASLYTMSHMAKLCGDRFIPSSAVAW